MALFSFKKTIVAGFIAALAIICFFAGYTYWNMQRAKHNNQKVEVTLRYLRITEKIFDNIQEIETGQRGYIISGKKDFLEPYLSGLQQMAKDTLLLKEVEKQSSERQSDIKQLLVLINRKVSFSASTIRLRDEKGNDFAEIGVRSAVGNKLMADIRQIVQKMEGEDRLLLKKYSDRRAAVDQQTTILFFVLAGLFLLFFVFFFWWIRQDVKKRLRSELTSRVQENTLLFKDILDRISDGFMALDKNWNFVYINKASETTSGRTDLIGKNIWKEFPDGVGNEFYEAYHRAMTTQEPVFIDAYYPGFDKWFENQIYPSAHGISIHSKDITEKKKTESKLTQAIERFDVVTNATSDILWEADLKTHTTWWNDNFYEKFGYTKNDEFTAGDVWEKLLHPDDKRRVTDNINFVLNNTSDVTWIDEYRMRKADGSYADIYDRCYIVRDAEGKAYSIVGSMTDISQLTQTREKLRITEDRYRIMIEEASDAIFINDAEGKFHDVNRRACEMLGYSEKELCEMRVEDLMPVDELAAKPIMYDELLSGKRTSLERNIRHKDGSLIPVDITARMMSEGRIIAIVRDISERKKTEELIQKSEEELKLIYNASGDVIFLISVEPGPYYRFKSVNDTFYKVTGLSEEHIINKRIDDVIPAESLAFVKSHYGEAIKNKTSVQWEEISEYPTGKKTGVVTVSPVFNDKGECILIVGGVHDITERKKIEEEVRRSKEDFTGLVNSIDGIVWEADAQTFEFSFVSQQAERLLGYPAQQWIDEPTFWADHIHPEDRDWAVNYCISSTKENRSHEFEYRMIRADGSILWLRDIVSVIAENEKPVRLRGIMIDITEKRKIDELITDSEEKRRLVMNAALDAIISIDASGAIIFWNPQAEKIFGWKENEIRGLLLSDTIIPEKYRESHKHGMARYLRTGEGPVINRLVELSAINKAGHEFPIELSIIPIVQEGVTTFTAFIRDITERKKVAAELSQSVERFDAIATATHDALWEWNFETDELWANDMHQQLYGLKKTDPVPRVEVWKRRIHPEDLDKTTNAQDMALASGINYWESEYRFLKGDNQYITVYDRCYIIRNKEGKPIRITGSMIDVTERRKAEEKFKALLESAPDAMVIVDESGKIVLANQQTEILFGYDKADLIGQSVELLVPVELHKMHQAHTGEYFKKPKTRSMGIGYELFAVRKDQSQFPVEISLSPLETPGGLLVSAAIRDITERKKAAEQLKKEKELSERIIETLPGLFYMIDETGRYIKWNKLKETISGYTHEEMANMTSLDFFDGEDKEHVLKAITDGFKNGVTEVEAHIITKQKEKLLYYFTGVVIDYEGRTCLMGMGVDITERRKAEAEVIKARDMADKIIDSLPGIFYLYDDKGNFLRWNKEHELVTGYSAEEMALMHPTDFFAEEDRAYIVERISHVFEHGEADAEANFLTKTGEKIPFYFKAVLLYYEGKRCFMGSGVNISERKKAEEELRQSEQKYKLLFNNNPLPLWMATIPELDIVGVNESAIQQYGYTREEFLALNAKDLRPEEDIPFFLEEVNKMSPNTNNTRTWRHKKKDGTIINVEIFSQEIIYEGRRVWLGLSNNITEKVTAETLLKKSFEDIRQLTEHIQKVREEERAHIAREIHDELGQQLTVLKMDVSWLNKKMQADTSVTERLNELTNMLDGTVKTVRRISSELRPSLLDDLGLVAAMDWHLKEFGKRTGISTSFEEPGDMMLFPENITTGLYRIFQESLTNVTRHAEATRVNVSLRQSGNEILLEVRDNGKGFDKEKAANKRTLGILGMKERTEMMGGSYVISSEQGKGTIVIVSIPNDQR